MSIPIVGQKRGYFISFEGLDGAGKSTQIDLLRQALQKNGFTVRMLREPGGNNISEAIREIVKNPKLKDMCPEAELLLMNASRAQLVREVIRPALDAGEIVLCDRFFHSTIVYQGWGRGIDLDIIKAMIHFAVEDTVPNVTFVLWLSIPEIERRKKDRGTKDRIESEKHPEFTKRVNQGYVWLAEQEPSAKGRIVGIEATGTKEGIHNEIYRCVAARISGLDENQLQMDAGKKIIKV